MARQLRIHNNYTVITWLLWFSRLPEWYDREIRRAFGPSGILQPIVRPLARRNASVARMPRVYSLFYKCLYTLHRLSRDAYRRARTLTRCFITADLAGAQTRNGSLITTATAI